MRTDFEMYTSAGNRAVAEAVANLISRAQAGNVRRTELPGEVRKLCEQVKAKHPEVYDTEPQHDIADVLNQALCAPEGWQPISRWDW